MKDGISRGVIRALVVDDEEPGRINLRYALAEHPRWHIAAECDGAAAARAALAGGAIDVVFLDIQMPHESGLTLARELAGQAEPPLIVFVTAHSSHAVDAFDVHALDYLCKPFDDARLAQTLARAAAMLEQRQRAAYGAALRAWSKPPNAYWREVRVRSVGRIECIRIDEVLWLQAAGNYVELHLASRQVLHRAPLRQVVANLDPSQFVQVHRGAVVRTAQIAALRRHDDGNHAVTLRCGDVVGVSERYLAVLKARLENASGG
ncbi:LytR/AlgR family response regulator transcription factor [Pseudoduganella plicata]|uniref:DNA-binding response regulator n=1 Tax=Pseudoduganella plicata TaxID=321984 RepID=A0AA87Y9Z1_9BURK|nr:LytTR family DNA-binding domain-containing protein [Pseudoduganella plicata]GGY82505.1 DNA-binding response regulator [Pseudoduganella plicata]